MENDVRSEMPYEADEGPVNLREKGGIYVIWDIMAGNAYVGQAKLFSNRKHKGELWSERDNEKLQKAF